MKMKCYQGQKEEDEVGCNPRDEVRRRRKETALVPRSQHDFTLEPHAIDCSSARDRQASMRKTLANIRKITGTSRFAQKVPRNPGSIERAPQATYGPQARRDEEMKREAQTVVRTW
jgi:hypothetical protein